jgi:uncharacterized membrane protein (UPF0127 family)
MKRLLGTALLSIMLASPLWAASRALTLQFNSAHTPAIWAETACDARTWQRGLQYRDHLMPDHGMLFVFPHAQNAPFWMKDTRIPPCTRDPCPLYAPHSAYRYVLEMRAGWFTEHGLRPGMQLATKALHHACSGTPAAP